MNTSFFTLERKQKKISLVDFVVVNLRFGKKMKMVMSSIKGLVCLVMLLGFMINIETVDGVSCGDAVNALIPCGSYLLGAGAAVPGPECCAGAQQLNKMATNVGDRRALCECLKQTGPSFGVKPERAGKLPSFCKLQINIPVSPNVDCSKIN